MREKILEDNYVREELLRAREMMCQKSQCHVLVDEDSGFWKGLWYLYSNCSEGMSSLVESTIREAFGRRIYLKRLQYR